MSASIVSLPGAAAAPVEQARMEHALTVKHPVSMAGSCVFEVREGVPLADAMGTLALLLATAQAASYGLATTAGKLEAGGGSRGRSGERGRCEHRRQRESLCDSLDAACRDHANTPSEEDGRAEQCLYVVGDLGLA